MDPTSESPPKGKSFNPAKIRRKYAVRWHVIGFILGMLVGRWREYEGWPWWQVTLVSIFICSVTTWIIEKDTK